MENREEVAHSSFWSWLILGCWFFFATRFMYTILLELRLPFDVVITTMVGVLVIAATTGFHNNFVYVSFFGYVGITLWLHVYYEIVGTKVTSAFDLAYLTLFFSTYTFFALFLKVEIHLLYREIKNG